MEAGIPQVRLAQLTKSTPAAVSRWLSAEHTPDIETLPRLAEVLGVTPAWLLGASDQMRSLPRKSLVPIRDEDKLPVQRLLRVDDGVRKYSRLLGKQTLFVDRRDLQRLSFSPVINDLTFDTPVFAVDVHDDAMSPGILKGDTLIAVDSLRRDEPEVESGRVYVLNWGGVQNSQRTTSGKPVVRRILRHGDSMHVLADNAAFEPQSVNLKQIPSMRDFVLGRPVKLLRDL